ncbi:uncharacterized protein [Ptychodera flava]|uniref:uncharacterized protein n=1 Tax=Ptychodera flava TaxID=63121 RepID=UPI00396A8798
MDVVSLYTNIPHSYGIQAVKEMIEENNTITVNPELICEMLQFILTKNYFEFNGQYYLQICGTAMGSKVAPSYANITMGKLERQILENYTPAPDNWKRFIDDVRFMWQHGLDQLKQFHQYCNSVHPTLQFTLEYSDKQISFLDTLMTLTEDKIETTVYNKTTDKHSYLWTTSCHPSHTFQAIPWSQSLRYRRICSNDDLFQTEATKLKNHLIKRNYKPRTISDAIKKAENINRSKLIQPTSSIKPTTHKRIPFVIEYNLPFHTYHQLSVNTGTYFSQTRPPAKSSRKHLS